MAQNMWAESVSFLRYLRGLLAGSQVCEWFSLLRLGQYRAHPQDWNSAQACECLLVASGRFIFGISEFLRSRRTLCTLLSWSHYAEYHAIYLRSAQNISSALESDNKHWLFVRIENVIQIPSAIHILNGLNKVNVLVEDRKLGNSWCGKALLDLMWWWSGDLLQ